MDNYCAIIKYGKHAIEVRLEKDGTEIVLYDDEMVSSKTGIFGTTHKFSVKEDGEDATYEVKIKPEGGFFEVITSSGMALTPIAEFYRNGEKIYPLV